MASACGEKMFLAKALNKTFESGKWKDESFSLSLISSAVNYQLSTLILHLSTPHSQGGTLEEGVFFALLCFALLCVPKYVFPAFKAFKVAFIALFVPIIALSVNFPVDYLCRF
ncbi:MAG: hypothetical protein J6C87_04455 [Bacteroides sp.]|nr:hypothetical protein [Bacteroides sp.]